MSTPDFESDVPNKKTLDELYSISAILKTTPSAVARQLYAIDNPDFMEALDASLPLTTNDVKEYSFLEIEDQYRSNTLNILKKVASIEWPEDDKEFEDVIRAEIASGLTPKKVFQALYIALLDKPHGPRLTKLLRLAGREYVTGVVTRYTQQDPHRLV